MAYNETYSKETIMKKKIMDTACGVIAIIHIIVIPDACFKN